MIVRLLLFATAREAAGRGRDDFELAPDAPLERLLADAVGRYGSNFETVLNTARVWVNGDEPAAELLTTLHEDDEVAVLPPVSGGAETPSGDTSFGDTSFGDSSPRLC